MAEDPDHQVRKILVLPQENIYEHIHDSAAEQLGVFTSFVDAKICDYKEVLNQNSAAVFAVNYVQNRFISTEFTVQIARLWDVLGVHTVAEFNKSIESMKGDSEYTALVEAYEIQANKFDELLKHIDAELDVKIGPSTTTEAPSEELSEMGIHSRTITHYVQGSPFDLAIRKNFLESRSGSTHSRFVQQDAGFSSFRLRCFYSDKRTTNWKPRLFTELRNMKLFSGGSYLKLIGVPFRKLYDEAEAVEELKAHRRSALQLAGWEALLKIVEITLIDETRQTPALEGAEKSEDQTAYITQKGGTILVNRNGKVLYKFVESEGCCWPTVETVSNEVKKVLSSTPAAKSRAKVQSEISVQQSQEQAETVKTEEKKCCTII